LSLPVLLDIGGVFLPVAPLVIRMTLAPLLLTQQAGLPVLRIGLLFLAVIGDLVAPSTTG
jgi:hypothetical protein